MFSGWHCLALKRRWPVIRTIAPIAKLKLMVSSLYQNALEATLIPRANVAKFVAATTFLPIRDMHISYIVAHEVFG